MKICMMTNTYLPHVGGVARSVHDFSETFRRRDHDVLVVAPTFEGADQLSARDEQHVVRLPAIQQFNGSDFSVRLPLTWLMDTRLNDYQPDIVHSHHPYLLGDSALRYAAEKNAPVIFTHHTLHEQYTHYVPFDSPQLKDFVIELCTRYANLCDAVVAPSESIADLIRRRGVTARIEVIPTGIDVKAFSGGDRRTFREKHDLPEDAFVIGHLGRLAPEKNLEHLARSVRRCLQDHENARFLVVGAGPSAEGVKQLFAADGLRSRLVLPGKLTGQDLYDAYAAMDVFGFCSFSETQGMVLAEAMAAGLPVVALDAPGAREVVRHDENGFLLEAKADEQTFADHLARLMRDDSLRRRMREAAATTALDFSAESSADKTLELYRRVLRQTLRTRALAERDSMGSLLRRIEMEWSLVTEKAGAFYDSVAGERATEDV